LAFRIANEDGAGVAGPDAVGGPLVEEDVIDVGVGTLEDAERAGFFFRVLNDEVDVFVCGEETDDFRVEPGDGLEFAGPVFRVVRPREPGGLMGGPFGGEAVMEGLRGFGHFYSCGWYRIPKCNSKSNRRSFDFAQENRRWFASVVSHPSDKNKDVAWMGHSLFVLGTLS
jgi:hypothetical protein